MVVGRAIMTNDVRNEQRAYPLRIHLDAVTRERLREMAGEQFRSPEEQASWIVREVLDDLALREWVRSKERGRK